MDLEIAKVVRNDWRQLNDAASLYRVLVNGRPLPRGLRTAICDSFAVRMRNLYEFLFHDYDPNRFPDDVRAVQFVPVPTWRHDTFGVLKDAKEKADKEVNHVTTRRRALSEADRTWTVAPIVDGLKHCLLMFESATGGAFTLDDGTMPVPTKFDATFTMSST